MVLSLRRTRRSPRPRPVLCCECMGTKVDPLDPRERCPVCRGLGAMDIVPAAMALEDDCE